jgi:hypothetical protein
MFWVSQGGPASHIRREKCIAKAHRARQLKSTARGMGLLSFLQPTTGQNDVCRIMLILSPLVRIIILCYAVYAE